MPTGRSGRRASNRDHPIPDAEAPKGRRRADRVSRTPGPPDPLPPRKVWQDGSSRRRGSWPGATPAGGDGHSGSRSPLRKRSWADPLAVVSPDWPWLPRPGRGVNGRGVNGSGVNGWLGPLQELIDQAPGLAWSPRSQSAPSARSSRNEAWNASRTRATSSSLWAIDRKNRWRPGTITPWRSRWA